MSNTKLITKKASDFSLEADGAYRLRAKFVKNNNTILIERFCNPYIETEKGSRPRWIYWYEIDLDRNEVSDVADFIAHVSQKTWITNNYGFFVELLDLWLSCLEIKKRII